MEKNAIGAIATHDIEVCLTTNEYPNVLINKCFEVEIVNNELHFDYKLRDGICKNRSATFLMKKNGSDLSQELVISVQFVIVRNEAKPLRRVIITNHCASTYDIRELCDSQRQEKRINKKPHHAKADEVFI